MVYENRLSNINSPYFFLNFYRKNPDLKINLRIKKIFHCSALLSTTASLIVFIKKQRMNS